MNEQNQPKWARNALKGFLVFLLSACVVTSCHGQAQAGNDERALRTSVPHRIGHYILTHKVPLAAGAVVVLANSADAVSTLRAERNCPTCIDYSLGRDPSPAKVWFNTQLGSALIIPFNLLAYHHYDKNGPEPEKGGQKFFALLFSIPLAIHGAMDTVDNTQIGPHSTLRLHQLLNSGDSLTIARGRLLSSSP